MLNDTNRFGAQTNEKIQFAAVKNVKFSGSKQIICFQKQGL